MTVYELIKSHNGNGCEIDKTIAINRLICARTGKVKQAYKYYKYWTKTTIETYGEALNQDALDTLNSEIELLLEALFEFPEYKQMPNYITAIKLLNSIKL